MKKKFKATKSKQAKDKAMIEWPPLGEEDHTTREGSPSEKQQAKRKWIEQR